MDVVSRMERKVVADLGLGGELLGNLSYVVLTLLTVWPPNPRTDWSLIGVLWFGLTQSTPSLFSFPFSLSHALFLFWYLRLLDASNAHVV